MLAAEVCNERVDLLLLLGPRQDRDEGVRDAGNRRHDEELPRQVLVDDARDPLVHVPGADAIPTELRDLPWLSQGTLSGVRTPR